MSEDYFPEELYTAGFTDLVSVIPPGAVLTPTSKIPQGSTGKAPGRRLPTGLWAGYHWQKAQHTLEEVRSWATAGANVGMRADRFPSVDIDCLDEGLASIIEDAAISILGPAPVRYGRRPKKLLVYRTDVPFGRMRLLIERAGAQHLVEILGVGQQYLVHGIHPTTLRPYEWEGDRTFPLTTITREQAEHFLTELTGLLELTADCTVRRIGDGRLVDRVAATDQGELLAPSLEILREAVSLIPNTDDLFPSRDDYIKVGYAVRAATGEAQLDEGFEIFSQWADRWPGGNTEAFADWRRMSPPFSIGWNFLADLARGHGFNAASLEFDVDPAAVPGSGLQPEIEEFNRLYAKVRSVANAVLYTPGHGRVDFMAKDHWKDIVANRKLARPGAKDVGLATAWLQHPQRRTFDRIVLDPEAAPLSAIPSDNGGEPDFNLWPGWAITPSAVGSCSLFLEHVRENVCGGDAEAYSWIMQWMAAMFQSPKRLPGTAVFLRGKQGTGKTTIGEVLRRVMGKALYCTLSSSKQLTAQFNSILEGKVLVLAEEAFFAGDPGIRGQLKHLITGETINIERKHMETITLPSMIHLLGTSNEDWVVAADSQGERRYAVFTVSNARANDRPYFSAMWKQLEAGGYENLLHHLLNAIVVDWDRISIPLASAAVRDQQLLSLPPERKFLLELLNEGDLPGDVDGSGVCGVDTLHGEFLSFMRDRQAGRNADKQALGRLVAPYLAKPKGQLRRNGKRSHHYTMRDLAKCRDIFAEGLSICPDWDDVDTWQSEFEPIAP
jgi:hypothetical protein